MSFRARQPTLGGPATVAIHDDGDVARHLRTRLARGFVCSALFMDQASCSQRHRADGVGVDCRSPRGLRPLNHQTCLISASLLVSD